MRHPAFSRLTFAALCAVAAVAAAPIAASADDDDHHHRGRHYGNERHDPDARHWRYGHHSRPAILPAWRIEAIICDQGWYDPHSISYDPHRGVYTAYAFGRHGRPFVLTINAYSGRILESVRLTRGWAPNHRGW